MFRILTIAIALITLTACSQLSSSEQETLETTIATTTERYTTCLNAYAEKYLASKETASFIVDAALSECNYLASDIERDVFALQDSKYLSSSFAKEEAERQTKQIMEDSRRSIVDRLVKERLGEF